MENSEIWKYVEQIYESSTKNLGFHSIKHVRFVMNEASKIGLQIGANIEKTCIAAMVHDFNYLMEPNSLPELGASLRIEVLKKFNYSDIFLREIENIVLESHTAYRSRKISLEGMALSDADTLIKSLPITPIIGARLYCLQNHISLEELGKKILKEQKGLLEEGIYFYTDFARKNYLHWAKTNIALWENLIEMYDGRIKLTDLYDF